MNRLKKCLLCKVEYKRHTHTCADPDGTILCSECTLKFRTTRCMFKHVKYAHAQSLTSGRSPSPILFEPSLPSPVHIQPTVMTAPLQPNIVNIESITVLNPPSTITHNSTSVPFEQFSESQNHLLQTNLIVSPSKNLIELPTFIKLEPTFTMEKLEESVSATTRPPEILIQSTSGLSKIPLTTLVESALPLPIATPSSTSVYSSATLGHFDTLSQIHSSSSSAGLQLESSLSSSLKQSPPVVNSRLLPSMPLLNN